MLYPAGISLRIGEIRSFLGKQRLTEFMNTKHLTRNVKETSLNGKEKAITRNFKIMKEKNLTGKGKHIVKV